MNSETSLGEKRKYIRMDTVFPVQFRLVSMDGKIFMSEWLQGFTNNVSDGGLCLRINNLSADLAGYVKNRQVRLSLEIEIPLVSKNSVSALASVAWIENIGEVSHKYLIGVSYDEIDPTGIERIMGYARAKKIFLPVVMLVIILMGLGMGLNAYINYRLVKGNKILVGQLVNVIQESSLTKERIKEINKDREGARLLIQTLESRIKSIEEEKEKLREEIRDEETENALLLTRLNARLGELTKEKNNLEQQVAFSREKENIASNRLRRLDEEKLVLTEANLNKMHRWLGVHQNPRTGLVMSFEGDSDLKGWAFIYDQSLASQAYAIFEDFERAAKILDFFAHKAKRSNGFFYNAYYHNDGSPAEYVIHCGPNIWIGIAALQYTGITGDTGYLQLAEDIAQAVISLQKEDNEGGLRGGPDMQWYSTEHNLDGYAFFDMLYGLTGKHEYVRARDDILKWLFSHTYDRQDPPIKRGKGDSTISTDTYSWSIAAIGPLKLKEMGMDPDKIIEFALANCSIEVSYKRPEGRVVRVRGFDFAPQRHLARGGVVSTEWTAQMVVSFKKMAEFYRKEKLIDKAAEYERLAENYLAELFKMIISSPSASGQGEGCLPYATDDFVNTGHGWMTPKGNATGSVAGTAYTIFAYYNHNPLELK